MSSTFVADTLDTQRSDNTVILIVNNDGSISMDQDALQSLIVNKPNTAVSVVRVGNQGDDSSQDSNSDPHVNLTVEEYFPPVQVGSSALTAGTSSASTSAVSAADGKGPVETPPPNSVLENNLDEILCANLLNTAPDLLNPDDQNALNDMILMDHSYTTLQSAKQVDEEEASDLDISQETQKALVGGKSSASPVRRSQRQLDKIEREQVEKIRAENEVLLRRERLLLENGAEMPAEQNAEPAAPPKEEVVDVALAPIVKSATSPVAAPGKRGRGRGNIPNGVKELPGNENVKEGPGNRGRGRGRGQAGRGRRAVTSSETHDSSEETELVSPVRGLNNSETKSAEDVKDNSENDETEEEKEKVTRRTRQAVTKKLLTGKTQKKAMKERLSQEQKGADLDGEGITVEDGKKVVDNPGPKKRVKRVIKRDSTKENSGVEENLVKRCDVVLQKMEIPLTRIDEVTRPKLAVKSTGKTSAKSNPTSANSSTVSTVTSSAKSDTVPTITASAKSDVASTVTTSAKSDGASALNTSMKSDAAVTLTTPAKSESASLSTAAAKSDAVSTLTTSTKSDKDKAPTGVDVSPRKHYPKRENRKPPAHLVDAFGPALFSTPDVIRRVGDKGPVTPTGGVPENIGGQQSVRKSPDKKSPVKVDGCEDTSTLTTASPVSDGAISRRDSHLSDVNEGSVENEETTQSEKVDETEALAVTDVGKMFEDGVFTLVVDEELKMEEVHPKEVQEEPNEENGAESPNEDDKKTRHLRKKKEIEEVEEVGEEEEEESEDDDEDYDSEDDPDRLWCICKKPHNNRFMICCDQCEDWFHGQCVGITKAMGRQMEDQGQEWSCPICLVKNKPSDSPLKDADENVAESPQKNGKGKDKVEENKLKRKDSTDGSLQHKAKPEQSQQVVNHPPALCIVCKKEALKFSIYCSEKCIQTHAQDSLNILNKEKVPAVKVVGADAKDTLKPASQPEVKSGDAVPCAQEPRVIVFERSSGKLLTGPTAPTMSNLKEWLKDHPTFEVIRPGILPTAKFYSNSSKTPVKIIKAVPGPQAGTVMRKTYVITPKPATVPSDTIPGTRKIVARVGENGELKMVPFETNPEMQPITKLKVTGTTLTGKPVSITLVGTKGSTVPSVNSVRVLPVTTPTSVKSVNSPVVSPTSKVAKSAPSATKPVKQSNPTKKTESKTSDNPKASPKKQDPEPIRLNVRKTLKDILLSRIKDSDDMKTEEKEVDKIAKTIEDALYSFFKDTGSKYKSKYRSLMFNIKDPKNPGLFRKILQGTVHPERLVRMSPDELASSELAAWREREQQHQLEMIKKNELDMISLGNTFVMKTHKGEQVIEKDDSLKLLESRNEKNVTPEASVRELVSGESITTNLDTTKEHGKHAYDVNCDVCKSKKKEIETKGKVLDKKDASIKKDKDKKDSGKDGSKERTKSESEKRSGSEEERSKKKDKKSGESKEKTSERRDSEKHRERKESASDRHKDKQRERRQSESDRSKDRKDGESERHRERKESGKRRESEKEREKIKSRKDSEGEKRKSHDGERRRRESESKDADRKRKESGGKEDRESERRHKESKDHERKRESDSKEAERKKKESESKVSQSKEKKRKEDEVKEKEKKKTEDEVKERERKRKEDEVKEIERKKKEDEVKEKEKKKKEDEVKERERKRKEDEVKERERKRKEDEVKEIERKKKEDEVKEKEKKKKEDEVKEIERKKKEDDVKEKEKKKKEEEEAERKRKEDDIINTERKRKEEEVKEAERKRKDEEIKEVEILIKEKEAEQWKQDEIDLRLEKAEALKRESENKEAEKKVSPDREVILESQRISYDDSDHSDREPSSTVVIKTPDINSDDPTSYPSTVWKGFINMPDVAKFFTTAHEVSGSAYNLNHDLPDTVDVVGRISPEAVWDYIAKMKKSGTKDILVIRFTPANYDEKVPYISLYSYLSSRDRFGVIGNASKFVKDFYIFPLASHSPVPQVLLPLDGPGFEDYRPHLLLGIVVRTKRKRLNEAAISVDRGLKVGRLTLSEVLKSQAHRPERSDSVDTLSPDINRDRSYTPPLPTDAEINEMANAVNSAASQSFTPPHPPPDEPPFLKRKAEDSLFDEVRRKKVIIDSPHFSPSGPLPSDDDDQTPYSPGGSSDDAEIMSAVASNLDFDHRKKLLDDLNRQIANEKLQIESMITAGSDADSSDAILQRDEAIAKEETGVVQLPLLGETEDQSATEKAEKEDEEEEAYSPSRSFTPPVPSESNSCGPTSSSAVTSDIALPADIREILATIKRKKKELYSLSSDSGKPISLKSDPIVQNYGKSEDEENSSEEASSEQTDDICVDYGVSPSSSFLPLFSKLAGPKDPRRRDPRRKPAVQPKSTLRNLSDNELLAKAAEMEELAPPLPPPVTTHHLPKPPPADLHRQPLPPGIDVPEQREMRGMQPPPEMRGMQPPPEMRGMQPPPEMRGMQPPPPGLDSYPTPIVSYGVYSPAPNQHMMHPMPTPTGPPVPRPVPPPLLHPHVAQPSHTSFPTSSQQPPFYPNGGQGIHPSFSHEVRNFQPPSFLQNNPNPEARGSHNYNRGSSPPFERVSGDDRRYESGNWGRRSRSSDKWQQHHERWSDEKSFGDRRSGHFSKGRHFHHKEHYRDQSGNKLWRAKNKKKNKSSKRRNSNDRRSDRDL